MIASYSKNFIFIKTQKTGGTSVEIVMSSWCQGRDICTLISPEDEILRYQFGGAARNFSDDPSTEAELSRLVNTADIAAIERFKQRHSGRFYNHMSAVKVRKVLPYLWDRALKITIERHPYDRVISMAFWAHNAKGDSLSEAIDQAIANPTFPNYPTYTKGGKVLVDKFIRYEHLAEDLAAVASAVGASVPPALPQAKARSRTDRRPAEEVLTHKQKRRIRDITGPEFEIMGYQP
jgi:hypothetical protein